MEEILGQAANLASGGLLGIAGSVLNRGLGIFERRQLRLERRDEMLHEMEMAQLQMQARGQEMEHEAAIVRDEGDAAIRIESYRQDASITGASRWVQDVRALTRPALTVLILLSYVASFFFIGVPDAELRALGFQQLGFTTSVVVAWWFGDRSADKPRTA